MQIQPIEQWQVAHCTELFLTVFNSPPWNEAWRTAAATKRLTDLFNTPGFYGVIAVEDRDAVGFAMGHVEQWDRGQHFYLKEMCVVPQGQRSGIGTALMETLCRELVARQVAKIYLLTARGSAAESFYKKRGFYVSQKMVMMGLYLSEETSG